jgi:hypothetical protein
MRERTVVDRDTIDVNRQQRSRRRHHRRPVPVRINDVRILTKLKSFAADVMRDSWILDS